MLRNNKHILYNDMKGGNNDMVNLLEGNGYVTKGELKTIVDHYHKMNSPQVAYKSLEESLKELRKAVISEGHDMDFYEELEKMATDNSDKEVLSSMSKDEKKHNKMLKDIYFDITGEKIEDTQNNNNSNNANNSYMNSAANNKGYIDRLKEAFHDEGEAAKNYTNIRAGLPNEFYRDMMLEIITDELVHADKCNYLIHKNQMQQLNNMSRDAADISMEKGYMENRNTMPIPILRQENQLVGTMSVENDNLKSNIEINGSEYASYYDYYRKVSKS